MATEEFVKRSVLAGKQYEALPERIKAAVSLSEWKQRVKEHCIQKGLDWSESLAKSASTEAEYYEDLLAFYRSNLRIFPYHLSEYICQVMRITPFRYSCDILYQVMREEKSYDRIPNFTAADIVRLTGVGRNEYISIMNKCKAKKLLWRVNRAIVKEMLPAEPADIEMQPWWTINVVNLGESEYRNLTPEELKLCQDACKPGGSKVQDVDISALQALYKRGLIYLDVEIQPSDHVSIPPLEGFVSNKDSEAGEDRGDPLEAVLYAVFVATSSRASVAELSAMLSVTESRLVAAVSLACRLGFAIRLPPSLGEDAVSQASEITTARESEQGGETDPNHSNSQTGGEVISNTSEQGGQAIALVVDAEVTSYLMMGALSPGLKRHSVTLFEGGRVTGSEATNELIKELYASAEQAKQFEGEMEMLAGYAGALAVALECIRQAGSPQPIELLRKESLAGLAPAAASRVLSHAYSAVVPITPLPAPPLPLAPGRPGPTNYGATAEASTPWIQLALYNATGECPLSLILLCGQRFCKLPPQLQGCSHALFWPWDADSVRAQGVPIVVEETFLLFSLNDHLRRTALIVQPVQLDNEVEPAVLPLLDIPLPLPSNASEAELGGFSPSDGSVTKIQLKSRVVEAIQELGLNHAVGRLRMLQVAQGDAKEPELPEAADSAADSSSQQQAPHRWLPLTIQLGFPLQPTNLCDAVCKAGTAIQFLQPESRRQHAAGQARLQQRLFSLISEFGACSNSLAPIANRPEDPLGYVDLPVSDLLITGSGEIHRPDFQGVVQGVCGLQVA